jgi:segregation and condensation protein B
LEYRVEKETALVQAILFLEAGPVDEGAIGRISGLSTDAVKTALDDLNEFLESNPKSGLELTRIGGGIMLSVKREHWEVLKERYGKKNEGKISRAAMETLAIVAYSQPVTRAEIEKIRGVNADNMIRLLLEKNLVEEAGKKDIPGRPVMYKTTKDFLKLFHLGSIAELPKLSEADVEKFELEGEKY